jgi:hypothetical protein
LHLIPRSYEHITALVNYKLSSLLSLLENFKVLARRALPDSDPKAGPCCVNQRRAVGSTKNKGDGIEEVGVPSATD